MDIGESTVSTRFFWCRTIYLEPNLTEKIDCRNALICGYSLWRLHRALILDQILCDVLHDK